MADINQTKEPGIHARVRDAGDRARSLADRLKNLRERLTGCEPEPASAKVDAPPPGHMDFAVNNLHGTFAACERELTRIETAI